VGYGLIKVLICTAKRTSVRESTSFKPFCVKISQGVWLPGRLGGSKVTDIVYFTYLPRSPCGSDRHQICSGGRFPVRNELCQISFQSVQGFSFCKGSKFGLSHRNEVSPLTQGLNYRSACDKHLIVNANALITGWAVAIHLSIGQWGVSTAPGSKTPEPIDTKLGLSNYVGDLTLTSKYGSNRSTWVVWAHV